VWCAVMRGRTSKSGVVWWWGVVCPSVTLPSSTPTIPASTPTTTPPRVYQGLHRSMYRLPGVLAHLATPQVCSDDLSSVTGRPMVASSPLEAQISTAIKVPHWDARFTLGPPIGLHALVLNQLSSDRSFNNLLSKNAPAALCCSLHGNV
jgi:hypothetical protein